MDYEHVEFAEAVRRLASRAGIPVVEEAGGSSGADDRSQQIRRRLLAVHAEAAAWFHENLLKSSAAEEARAYLKSRCLSQEIARSWQIGFAPDSWDALLDHLRGKNFSDAVLALSGLATSKDGGGMSQHLYARFRGRVMFPVRNDYGEVIAFSGRLLAEDAKVAKYVNSPETPLFSKSRVLFGLDKTKRALIDAKIAVVLEGQIDVIRAFESGVKNVIAPQGTAFTHEQARLLSRFVESVVLCFDSDRAGQEAVARSLPALLGCGLPVRVARLPEGHDPDSLIRAEGPGAFAAAVEAAADFFDHAALRIVESGAREDPSRMAAATRKLAGFVHLVKDPVARDAVSGKICARLGIAPQAFLSQLRSVKSPGGEAHPEGDPQEETSPPMELCEGVALLCRLAAISPECRAFLAGQSVPPPERLGPGGDLLSRILAAPAALDSPSARATFSSSLPRAMENAFAAIDLSHLPKEPLETCRSAWCGLAAGLLRQERDAIQARMRQTDLSQTQLGEFQKQLLDLTARLNDLFTPAA